ncbi:MAG: putative toxin-antitoxin system toxin component, PIN family [Patescibacteria group bacterium]
MSKKQKTKVFLDSSVIIAALLSSTGGSFRICKESHEGRLMLQANKYVLKELREVLNRKYPERLEQLSLLLQFAKIKIRSNPKVQLVEQSVKIIQAEDAPILAGAIQARANFLITLDRKDFMTKKLAESGLPLIIVTPETFFKEHWID